MLREIGGAEGSNRDEEISDKGKTTKMMKKKPRGRGDLVVHKVAERVGVDVKCAPGEVTEERGMAASLSVLQSKKKVKVGCKEQREKRKRKREYKQVFF